MKNLTQEEAASRIGIKYRTYQTHESGQAPSRRTFRKYVNFYGCDEGWLLTGKGEPFPGQEGNQLNYGAPPPSAMELREKGGGYSARSQHAVQDQHISAALDSLVRILSVKDDTIRDAILSNLRALTRSVGLLYENELLKEQVGLLRTQNDILASQNSEFSKMKRKLEILEHRMSRIEQLFERHARPPAQENRAFMRELSTILHSEASRDESQPAPNP